MADRKKRAADFAQRWKDRGSETGETREFWEDLLENVLDVPKPYQFIQTEKKVKIDGHNRRIDVYIPKTKILVEQKDKSISLDHKGPLGTAYEQARLYESELPLPEKPKWIITCNFKEFRIYDRVRPNLNPVIFTLDELPDNIGSLEILANEEIRRIAKEEKASIKAAEIISKLYNSILDEYKNPTDDELDSLNIFCVRLAFCMYLEDAEVFNRDSFRNLVEDYMARPWDLRDEIFRLFDVLDTPIKDRDKYLPSNLKHFPYVDGELFSRHKLIIPQFTETIVKNIYNACNFGWEEISPAIFGAAYESTINPETRRKYGMHYTSQENIHKVIDPLFLDDLKAEVEEALNKTVEGGSRTKAINSLREKLANLQFLDPACGSGNFLTETYTELRRLENILIAEQVKRETKISDGVQITAGFEENIDQLIQVKLDHFHGIEIQPFAVAVARTSLWIAEIKMKKETNELINTDSISILPLQTKPNIHHKNALTIDWNSIVPAIECDYIMGNPPYSGARIMNKDMKNDVFHVFGKNWSHIGDLDYISCWFKKASDYMTNTKIEAAFVSTNSISQGMNITNLWKPLFEDGLQIDFAYQSFKWDSKSLNKAHVICVIIGFSKFQNSKPKVIFTKSGDKIVNHINGYLLEGEDVYLKKRTTPIDHKPIMIQGSFPLDKGHLLLNQEEYEEYLKKEPRGEKFIKPYMMGREFLYSTPRYCFWLVDLTPKELNQLPVLKKRIAKVRAFRESSKRKSTYEAKDRPHLFVALNQPNRNFIALPVVSSEKRRYIPMDFMNKDIIIGNKLFAVPTDSFFIFGVLNSNVHNAWMRVVTGRLEMRYSYSNTLVYNNFPWPKPTEKQKKKIEQTAQAILDARANYLDSSLADLYDELTMPEDLRKAHRANDRAVMEAYGFSYDMSEEEIVAELMKLYQKLVDEK